MANQTHEYAGLGASNSQVASTTLVLAAGRVVHPDHVMLSQLN